MSAIILQFERMTDAPNRIKELRVAKGLTQAELADRAAMSKMNVSDIERGNVTLNIDHMRRIGGALGVAPGDLLSPTENPHCATEQEFDLLSRLRYADPATRDQVARVLDALLPPAINDDQIQTGTG